MGSLSDDRVLLVPFNGIERLVIQMAKVGGRANDGERGISFKAGREASSISKGPVLSGPKRAQPQRP